QTLLGAALAAGGTLALNQVIERELDARMERTRRRPLPAGRLRPAEAAVFGIGVTAAGLAVLALGVNPASGLTVAVILVIYLFVYTPLKRRSSLCTLFGAVPGALPPVAGWLAAGGRLGPEPLILFAILFLWQRPHTLAIACVHRADYARAGLCLPPVLDPEWHSTGAQVVVQSAALLVAGLLPGLTGMAGLVYLLGAAGLGIGVLGYALGLAGSRSVADARRLMLASLAYLPALFALLALDRTAF
ncbi:MAG TPA: heme o synthase, partial [Candidatus Sulfotelmatobacter sp.]|nr:heme o synthase [Candidatus Sulfotelmatobacter sp.]